MKGVYEYLKIEEIDRKIIQVKLEKERSKEGEKRERKEETNGRQKECEVLGSVSNKISVSLLSQTEVMYMLFVYKMSEMKYYVCEE